MNLIEHGIILEATQNEFESQAVLNPACILKDGIVHMYYRAVKPGNYSTIGYCRLKDNKVVYRHEKPVLNIDFAYERHGVEDPRAIWFEDKCYIFYTAYDGIDACICYATSTDLIHFKKHGIISPKLYCDDIYGSIPNNQDADLQLIYAANEVFEDIKSKILFDKDGYIFPKRIRGQIAFVHRLRPSIQLLYCNDLSDLNYKTWRQNLCNIDEYILLDQLYWYESEYIGGGCPPIETEAGWLLIYHAIEDTEDGKKIYRASAALLDINYPTHVIGRLKEPLFAPDEVWEKYGDVNNVVFPTGAVVIDGILYIYYGAADKCIACRSVILQELLDQLKNDYEHRAIPGTSGEAVGI